MTDYIKREDAIEAFDPSQRRDWYTPWIVETLEGLPSADAVPVVRCKDCRHWTEWGSNTGSCSRFALDWIGTDADDFCSMAERRDDE